MIDQAAKAPVLLCGINIFFFFIKFTAEISEEKADFLDTTVHKSPNGKLWTDLFCKPTDMHSYLRYESAHPPHCKKSLPYSQFLRLRRICSREEDFQRHCLDMKGHFLNRGYPDAILSEAIAKASSLSRTDLLNPKTPDTVPVATDTEALKVFAITMYHPTHNNFRNIITDNWNLLGSPGTQNLFEAQIVFGNRRPTNLREHLVRAAIKVAVDPAAPTIPNRDKECGSPGRCNYCPRLDLTGLIKGKSDGRKFRSRTSINCRSNNLVYAIECTHCGMHYVGQTKRRLMDRMVSHFASIKSEQVKYPVGHHFARKNHHQGPADVRLFVPLGTPGPQG